MHSPETLAFEIKNPFSKNKYPDTLISVWHIDPETDGTDDSCGWFIRERHLPKGIIDKVVKSFEFEWDRTFTGSEGFVYNCGWFNSEGENVLSVRGIVLNMYLLAFKQLIDPNNDNPGKTWDKAWKFLNKNYAQIMYFAENNTDSIRDTIVRKYEIGCNEPYTKQRRAEMIRNCASIVTCDIARRIQPWYKHPRWHFWHWKIQFHPFNDLKRRWWDKCSKCGKRGFKGSAYGNWKGTEIWHPECDKLEKK